MAIGNWDTSNSILDIPYHTDITILGHQFTYNVNSTAVKAWNSLIECEPLLEKHKIGI